MSRFLQSCICNGRKPEGGPVRHNRRPRVTRMLLTDRSRPRFIVAPDGFGKTSIALEYACDMAGYQNTIWIPGSSPCFLRDLDNGEMLQFVHDVPDKGILVVFDGVPFLDADRAAGFSKVVDAAIRRGWEVLVTCIPTYDVLGDYHPDRVLLMPDDLLLDAAELSETGRSLVDGPLSRADRIPAIVWEDGASRQQLIDGLRVPEMTDDMKLVLLVALMLQEGTYEDLQFFARGSKKETFSHMEKMFPHVGFDAIAENFHAVSIEASAVYLAFKPDITHLARLSSSGSADKLVADLANHLIAQRRYLRMKDLVLAAMPKKKRMIWFQESQFALYLDNQFLLSQEVFESFTSTPTGLTPSLLIGAMIRYAVLRDEESMAAMAGRVFSSETTGRDCKVIAACMCLCLPCHAQEKRANRILKNIGPRCADDQEEPPARVAQARAAGKRMVSSGLVTPLFPDTFERWCANAAKLLESLVRSQPEEAVGFISQGGFSTVSDPVSLISLVLAVQRLRQGPIDQRIVWGAEALRVLNMGVIRVLFAQMAQHKVRPNVFEAMLHQVCVIQDQLLDESYEYPVYRAQRDQELMDGLEVQRYQCRQRGRGASGTKDKPQAQAAQAQPIIPQLSVKLLGGISASIDGRMIDPRRFARQRSKSMLAILTINKGSEVSKDFFSRSLWPELTDKSAANCLYVTWSDLNKALSIDGSASPYLIRQSSTYMMDSRFVVSDLDELDDLCQRLMFEGPHSEDWSEVYLKLSATYRGELVPSDTVTPYLDAVRCRYRNKVVDALVKASERLCQAADPLAALWFGRLALEQDGSREDVYRTLIRSQGMAGQKADASETLQLCYEALAEQGLAPSRETLQLYNRLVLNLP